MGMLLTIIPSRIFLPRESVKLGRLIVNISDPHEGYHDSPSAEEPKIITTPFKFAGQGSNEAQKEFGTTLTSLLSAAFSKKAKAEVGIAPTHVTEYLLDNSDEWFDTILSEERTRKWLEKTAVRVNKIYMIVGIQTVTDAHIMQSSSRKRQIEGQVDVPVTLSLAAAGIVVPFAGLIDPSVHGGYLSSEGGQSEYLAPGEQVCALQYRKLSYKWLSSRQVDTLRLSPTRHWLCTEGNKRHAFDDEDEDAEDVIEVDLGHMDDLQGELMFEDCGDRRICIPE